MGEETEFIKKQTAWEKLLYWKLAIFKVSGKAFMALVLSIVASLNGNAWSTFDDTQKFVAIVTAIGSMWAVIDAFLSTTMSELQNKDKTK